MSLAAPVEECVPSPSCQVWVFSRRRHSPIFQTFPQAPKLSTALLGRNRSGSGKGGTPGRLGPSSWKGATWGLPPSKRGILF